MQVQIQNTNSNSNVDLNANSNSKVIGKALIVGPVDFLVRNVKNAHFFQPLLVPNG
jgi:hypothetical protein